LGGRTRTRTEAKARESGYGSSRRESSEGRLQGRERHGTRPRNVGAPRRTTCSVRGACVPRAQPEPSRGARTLRTAPVRAWRPSPSPARPRGLVGATRGTRRSAFEGARTPGEVIPSLRIVDGCVSGHRDTEARAVETRSDSEWEANFRRGSPGTLVAGVDRDEKNPEAVETAWGERWKPRRRYSLRRTNL